MVLGIENVLAGTSRRSGEVHVVLAGVVGDMDVDIVSLAAHEVTMDCLGVHVEFPLCHPILQAVGSDGHCSGDTPTMVVGFGSILGMNLVLLGPEGSDHRIVEGRMRHAGCVDRVGDGLAVRRGMEVNAVVTRLVNCLDMVVLQARDAGLDMGGVGMKFVFRHRCPIGGGYNVFGAHSVPIPDRVNLNRAVVDGCSVGSYVICVLGMGGAGGRRRVGERGRRGEEDGDDEEESKNKNHGWM